MVRLSQNVWDGYQRREKTCLVLFDFERASDTVWHDGLLSKLGEMGVSRTVIRWVQEWLLKNRLYWVRGSTELGPRQVGHVMQCVTGERMRVELGLSDRLSVLCCRPQEALEY